MRRTAGIAVTVVKMSRGFTVIIQFDPVAAVCENNKSVPFQRTAEIVIAEIIGTCRKIDLRVEYRLIQSAFDSGMLRIPVQIGS